MIDLLHVGPTYSIKGFHSLSVPSVCMSQRDETGSNREQNLLLQRKRFFTHSFHQKVNDWSIALLSLSLSLLCSLCACMRACGVCVCVTSRWTGQELVKCCFGSFCCMWQLCGAVDLRMWDWGGKPWHTLFAMWQLFLCNVEISQRRARLCSIM